MKNVSLKIRRAHPSDWDIVTRFNVQLAAETEDIRLDPRRARIGVKAVLRDAHKGFYLVAERDGAVVGQLMITFEWSDWRNGWFWWIQSVYVALEHRRTGVIRALFERVRELAKRQNVCGFRLYVDKQNKSAQKVYAAMGMSRANYDFYQVEFGRSKRMM
jgi:GNAT superfamily N-acetyltransferase